MSAWPKHTASQSPFAAFTIDVGNEFLFTSGIAGAKNLVTLEFLGAFS